MTDVLLQAREFGQREENALKRPRDKQEQREDSHEKMEVETGFVQL